MHPLHVDMHVLVSLAEVKFLGLDSSLEYVFLKLPVHIDFNAVHQPPHLLTNVVDGRL